MRHATFQITRVIFQSIQIKLVLGHSAQWRKKPTVEGYTHDWTILVRGEDGQSIGHFVEKVVFFLHESFAKPRRGEILTVHAENSLGWLGEFTCVTFTECVVVSTAMLYFLFSFCQ